MDVCSIKDICGKGGTCVRSASNNTLYSYECICSEGQTGRNCEHLVVLKTCPRVHFFKTN